MTLVLISGHLVSNKKTLLCPVFLIYSIRASVSVLSTCDIFNLKASTLSTHLFNICFEFKAGHRVAIIFQNLINYYFKIKKVLSKYIVF